MTRSEHLGYGHPATRSHDMITASLARLRELFPELVREGHGEVRLDLEVLQALVGDSVVQAGEETYALTWHGKRAARQHALTPSTGTLRPCRAESLQWDSTQNLLIEGDNLEVLKLLQASYAGSVKLIYIDPPYNTGRDFVYPDRFADSLQSYLELTGQSEGGRKLSTHTEASGRFHTAWLSMMYPRLLLARTLLRDDGIIVISIDDHEVANLRKLCDEVFGEENLIGQLVWKSKSGGANDSRHLAVDHEYLVIYARRFEAVELNLDTEAEVTTRYNLRDEHGAYALDRLDKQSLGYVASLDFPIHGPDGQVYRVEHKNPAQKVARWRWGQATVHERYHELVFRDGYVYTKNYQKVGALPRSLLIEERFGRTRSGKTELAELMGAQLFDNPKPVRLLQHLLSVATRDGDRVLDFFAGSGTLGHAVWAQNRKDGATRRFVLVQLPEPLDPAHKEQQAAAHFCDALGVPRTLAELTKERMRRAAAGLTGSDLGFRVFRLGTSNLHTWEPKHDDLASALLKAVDPIKPDRSNDDVLFELLLKHGLGLCTPVEMRHLAGKEVASIASGTLLVCLAQQLSRDEAQTLGTELVAWRRQLEPVGDTTCIFRDSAFVDDVAKVNLILLLAHHGLTQVRTL
jgi:adenine-specific DNA-methyltransferase